MYSFSFVDGYWLFVFVCLCGGIYFDVILFLPFFQIPGEVAVVCVDVV